MASALHRDSPYATLNTELDSKEHQNTSKSVKHLQLSHIIMLSGNCATATECWCPFAAAQMINMVGSLWNWIYINSDVFQAKQQKCFKVGHSHPRVKQSFANKWFWMSLLPSGCPQMFSSPSWLSQAVSPQNKQKTVLLPLIEILPHSIYPLVIHILSPTKLMSIAWHGWSLQICP